MRDKTCRAFDTLSASDVYLTADVHTAVPSLTLLCRYKQHIDYKYGKP